MFLFPIALLNLLSPNLVIYPMSCFITLPLVVAPFRGKSRKQPPSQDLLRRLFREHLAETAESEIALMADIKTLENYESMHAIEDALGIGTCTGTHLAPATCTVYS